MFAILYTQTEASELLILLLLSRLLTHLNVMPAESAMLLSLQCCCLVNSNINSLNVAEAFIWVNLNALSEASDLSTIHLIFESLVFSLKLSCASICLC